MAGTANVPGEAATPGLISGLAYVGHCLPPHAPTVTHRQEGGAPASHPDPLPSATFRTFFAQEAANKLSGVIWCLSHPEDVSGGGGGVELSLQIHLQLGVTVVTVWQCRPSLSIRRFGSTRACSGNLQRLTGGRARPQGGLRTAVSTKKSYPRTAPGAESPGVQVPVTSKGRGHQPLVDGRRLAHGHLPRGTCKVTPISLSI